MKKARMVLLSVLLCCLAVAGCSKPGTVDAMKPSVSVSFAYGGGLRYPPSCAIWVEDEDGNTATLYATKKAVREWGPERANLLPVWFGVKEDGIDAVAGATPSSQAFIQVNLPESFADKKLTLLIEANASFDYNDYFQEGLEPGNDGYSDVNGQPSVVWAAVLDPAAIRGEVVPALLGAGEVMGSDHEIHTDLSNITTAKELLKDMVVKFDFVN